MSGLPMPGGRAELQRVPFISTLVAGLLMVLTVNACQAVAPRAGAATNRTSEANASPSSLAAVSTDPSRQAGSLPSIGLTSRLGGMDVPFTVGQVFRRGDVPMDRQIHADSPSFQAVVRNRWPDGSAKIVVLSGRMPMTAGQKSVLNLSHRPTTTKDDRRDLSLAALRAVMPAVRVELAPIGSAVLADVLANPHRQTIAGPVMSEWIFRQPVGADPHLVVWWRVRFYGDRNPDIMVAVENGYLTVADPGPRQYRVAVSIDGIERFARDLRHLHHTRWAARFWVDQDPDVIPTHDGRYLRDTRLFPNYGWRSPSDQALNALANSLEPFARNEFPVEMGSPGFHPSIGLLPVWDALYVTSGDERAWRAMMANAFSYGRYGVHFRDESTQQPVRLIDHPHLVADRSSGIRAAGDSEIKSFTPGADQGTIPVWIASHHPAPPYAAALLSGEWWMIEEVQFVASTNALHVSDTWRGHGEGLVLTFGANNERGAAWRLRTLAMAITATPDDWPIQAEYRRQWENSLRNLADRHIRGKIGGGRFVNHLGIFQSQPDGPAPLKRFESFWGPGWMQAFIQAVLGFTWDMDVGAREDHRQVRDFAYRLTTGLMGDSTGWDYRRGGVYDMPIARSWLDQTRYFDSFGAMLEDYEANKRLQSIAGIDDTRLRRESTDGPAHYRDFADGFWGNHQPARAYAVDHDAPGAVAGYRRITSASNYSILLKGLDDLPVWGIVPRALPGEPAR